MQHGWRSVAWAERAKIVGYSVRSEAIKELGIGDIILGKACIATAMEFEAVFWNARVTASSTSLLYKP